MNLGVHREIGGKTVACALAFFLLLVLMQWPVGGHLPNGNLPFTSSEENKTMDTDPPAAPELTSAVLTGNSNEDVAITWMLSADDGAGNNDVSHYAVYVSDAYDHEGDSYSFLGQAGSGETSFTHSMAGDGDWANHFYYVQANDSSGNSNWSGQAGKFVRSLEKGDQLVSIPLAQKDTTLEVVLQTLAGSFQHVRYYKSSDHTQHWRSYWTFKTYRTLYDLNHKMGFWIDMTQDDHLVVAGLVPEVTQVELGHEWNLVGYPSFVDRTVSGALAGIDWAKVEGWGSTPPYHQRQVNVSDIMTAGSAYWIWVDLPQVWTVTNAPSLPPYIVWTDPEDGELDVPLDQNLSVRFSKPMDTSSVSLAMAPAMIFSMDWFDSDTLMVLSHTTPLVECTQYTFTVMSGLDKSGNPLVPGPVPNPWTFTTIVLCPYVVFTDPLHHQTDVHLTDDIVVVFSRPMNASSLNWSITPDPGGWSENWPSDNMLVLRHSNPFQPFTRYTFTVEYIEDAWGTPLCPLPFVVTFTTT